MIKLVIADDHPVVREGIKRIVEACAGMTVVGEAASGAEAIARCRESAADVLLLDISMPGPGFLSVLEQLRARCPSPRVLVLSAHDEQSYALRALRAGAAGYLDKAHSVEALEGAIRRVAGGRRYISPALA